MNYLINFNALIDKANVVNKRKSIHSAWLHVLVEPLQTLNDDYFKVFYPDKVAKTKRTGQKIILEDTLNKEFNPGGARRITIDNSGDNLETLFFYNEDEGYPAQTFSNEGEGLPFYFSNEGEFNGLTGFAVFVPTEIGPFYSNALISSEVDKYRPASTQFTIINY